MAVQQAAEPAGELLRRLAHPGAEPFEPQADKGEFIKVRNELFFLLAHGAVPGELVQGSAQDGVGGAVEVVFQLLAADGVVDRGEEAALLQDVAAEPAKALLPGFAVERAAEGGAALLAADPLDKVVNVAEVVIDCLLYTSRAGSACARSGRGT